VAADGETLLRGFNPHIQPVVGESEGVAIKGTGRSQQAEKDA
jgi:hypothetical protein